MLTIMEDTASVSVAHESIAITGVLEGNINTVDGQEAFLKFTLHTPDLMLAHVEFRCGDDHLSCSIHLKLLDSLRTKCLFPADSAAILR